jgi:opacity protein-like surface antigen
MKGKSKMRYLYMSFCASVVFLLAVSSPALAQSIAAGSVEASGTFGYARVDGVTSNNHFAFGGAGIYNLNQIAAVGFEYSYTPLGSETISGISASEHLQTYGGVTHFSFCESSVAPYALVGFGGANLKAIASYEGMSASASQSGYYYAFGGGVNIFVGPRWGIRPEYRYERQQFNGTNVGGMLVGAFGQNDSQALVSFFYQFGGRQH